MTGISGINSMWWAQRGIPVSLIDDDPNRVALIESLWLEFSMKVKTFCLKDGFNILPLKDNTFDMVWSFAALGFLLFPDQFLKEMARVGAKVIFICIPNKSNISYAFRSMCDEKSVHTQPRNMDPKEIICTMDKLNWSIRDSGYLDVPPWPDIAMSKEDLLRDIGLRKLSDRLRNKRRRNICILDYFSGKKKDMEKMVLKYAFLEDMPDVIKRFWAHHCYLIFTPNH
jgi:hypothetical protein